jgi:hypothetical protein
MADPETEGEGVSEEEEAVALLSAMFAAGRGKDFEPVAGPLFWPALNADDAAEQWSELRTWVERLLGRFEHLDHHVIPLCWWQHSGHVEALVALRDHERMSYSDQSPPSAGVEWHRAFREIEARLREWTAQLACGAQHAPQSSPPRVIAADHWDDFVAGDIARRPASPPAEEER